MAADRIEELAKIVPINLSTGLAYLTGAGEKTIATHWPAIVRVLRAARKSGNRLSSNKDDIELCAALDALNGGEP